MGKAVLLVTVIIAAWIAFRMIYPSENPGASSGPAGGRFPSMGRLVRILSEAEYFLLNADGAVETLDGRKLQRFSYAVAGNRELRSLARINLWCEVNDPEQIVAMSTYIPRDANPDELLGAESSSADVKLMKKMLSALNHRTAAWAMIWDFCSINELDESRAISRNGARGREYRKGGFLMEIHEKTPTTQARAKLFYDRQLVLKDGSW